MEAVIEGAQLKIRAVLFDFDGTLVNSYSYFIEGVKRYAPILGYRVPQDKETASMRTRPAREIIKTLGISTYKLPLLVTLVRWEMKKAIAELDLFPGVHELLHELRKKIPFLGVVSSNSEGLVKAVLKRHDCELFDAYCCGISLAGKAAVMSKLIKRKKLDKKKTLLIGDEYRDLVAAKETGIQSGAVSWGYNAAHYLADGHPDFLFESPEQILAAF